MPKSTVNVEDSLDVGPRLVRIECGLAGVSESSSGTCCEVGKG